MAYLTHIQIQPIDSMLSLSSMQSPSNNDCRVVANNTERSSLVPLDLPPGTTNIVINIGANTNPILPRKADGPCALSIVFEPLVHSQIELHPQLMVIPAAVSARTSGIATMYDYGRNSVSSSLLHAAKASFWNGGLRGGQGAGRPMLVPVVHPIDVLRVIPSHIPISFILTDIQGHDYDVMQAAIAVIRERNVTAIQTEVFLDQKVSFMDAKNDLCLHWLPLMTQHGYVLEALNPPRENYTSHDEAIETCHHQVNDFYTNRNGTFQNALKERDALWRLATIPEPLGIEFFQEHAPLYPNLVGLIKFRKQVEHLFPNFTTSDYQQCNEPLRQHGS
jgi:hypothetical protein